MTALLNYNVNKFFLMFIPKKILEKLPTLLGAVITTIIPYTPINVIIFSVIFLIVYIFNPFGLSNNTIHYCRFNKLSDRNESSVWKALKSSYYYYFLIATLVNYDTIRIYHSLPKII